MKIQRIITFCFFICSLFVLAQNDSLYIMKNGAIIDKYKITNIDSIIYYNPNTTPLLEPTGPGIYSNRFGDAIFSLFSSDSANPSVSAIDYATSDTYYGTHALKLVLPKWNSGGTNDWHVAGFFTNLNNFRVPNGTTLEFWIKPDASSALKINIESSPTWDGTFIREVYPATNETIELTGGQWTKIVLPLKGNTINNIIKQISFENLGPNDWENLRIDEIILNTAADNGGALFTIGEASPVGDPGMPLIPYFPDGHITWLYNAPGEYLMFWAVWDSYRTVGTWPISSMALNPSEPVLLKGTENSSIDNRGAWLMSVARQNGDNLIGFYHAEDAYWGGAPNPEKIAYKSIALTTSADNGITWTKHGPIITSYHPKPETMDWTGAGDHCTVWDNINNRWVCFYQEQYPPLDTSIFMAISNDPNGAPGTWYKYNGDFSSFTEPGLGGDGKPVPVLANQPGANPSVHWNTYLSKWVMVYHGFDPNPKLYISYSSDLMSWSSPHVLVDNDGGVSRMHYPTILSAESDVEAGETATLLYAFWPDKNDYTGDRLFLQRTITFKKLETP